MYIRYERSGRMDGDISIYEKIRLNRIKETPIWEKKCLTIEEAAAYSGVGRTKIRVLTDQAKCPFVIWMDGKRFIIREQLDKYLNKQYKI